MNFKIFISKIDKIKQWQYIVTEKTDKILLTYKNMLIVLIFLCAGLLYKRQANNKVLGQGSRIFGGNWCRRGNGFLWHQRCYSKLRMCRLGSLRCLKLLLIRSFVSSGIPNCYCFFFCFSVFKLLRFQCFLLSSSYFFPILSAKKWEMTRQIFLKFWGMIVNIMISLTCVTVVDWGDPGLVPECRMFFLFSNFFFKVFIFKLMGLKCFPF